MKAHRLHKRKRRIAHQAWLDSLSFNYEIHTPFRDVTPRCDYETPFRNAIVDALRTGEPLQWPKKATPVYPWKSIYGENVSISEGENL